MEKWVISAKKADFYEISRKFGVDPVIARLIRNRDQITDEEIDRYLHGKMSGLHSWKLLKGVDTALDILLDKIREGKRLRSSGTMISTVYAPLTFCSPDLAIREPVWMWISPTE